MLPQWAVAAVAEFFELSNFACVRVDGVSEESLVVLFNLLFLVDCQLCRLTNVAVGAGAMFVFGNTC